MSEKTPSAVLPPLEPNTVTGQLGRKVGGREALTLITQMLIGGIVGAAISMAAMKTAMAQAPAGTNPALVALMVFPSMLLALVAHLIVHELGHALVGQWFGGKIVRIIIGPWRWELFRGGFRRSRVRLLKGVGGLAQTYLPVGAGFKGAFVAMVLGGPLANLLLALAAWLLLPALGPWPIKVVAISIAGIGLLIGGVNLLPFKSGGFQTDGLQLLRVWTDPQALALRQRVLRLARASLDGVRPREFDACDLNSLAIDGAQGLEKFAAQLVHASVAYDRGDLAAARELLAPTLADWQKLPDGLRQSLASLAAALAVELDGDVATARQWLERTEAGLMHPFEVEWVRAKACALEGDRAGRDAALARMREQLDETIYRGDERVYREKRAALV